MKKKISVTIITFLILVVGSYFYLQTDKKEKIVKEETPEIGIEVGQQAPDFELFNLSNQPVKLSDYRGKKVLLNFWASWCPPCRQEMPDLQKLFKNNQTEINIVAVNIGEDKATVFDYALSNKLSFPILLDSNRSISQQYLVRGIPSSYFLDENGIIINQTVGAMSYQKMTELAQLE